MLLFLEGISFLKQLAHRSRHCDIDMKLFHKINLELPKYLQCIENKIVLDLKFITKSNKCLKKTEISFKCSKLNVFNKKNLCNKKF